MEEIALILIPIILISIFAIFIWKAWNAKKEEKAGFVVKDERTQLVEGKAARITVIFTGYFMLVLLWYSFAADNFELGLPILETGWALILSLLFNSFLYMGLSWHFNKQRDLA